MFSKINIAILLALAPVMLQAQTEQHTLTAQGNCGMCLDRIEEAALLTKSVKRASYNLDNHQLTVWTTNGFNIEQLHNNVAKAGHDTDQVKADDAAYEQLPECCQYRGTNHHDSDGLLFGVVYEKSGKGNQKNPLVGANVRWLQEAIGTSTDASGGFQISKKEGSNQLIISYIGFNNDTIGIEGQSHIEVAMNESVLLDEVEVTARKRSSEVSFLSAGKVHKITERELTKAACCNLSESFETNPSVDVSFTDAVTGTRTIEMLGLAGPYVQIGRENMPDIRGLSAISGFTYIPGSWIEGIQLNLGTGSVVNGFESIAGQINVELKKPFSTERLYLNGYYNENGRLEGNLVANTPVGKKWHSGLLLHYNQRDHGLDQNNDNFVDMPSGRMFIAANTWKFQGNDGLEGQFGFKITDSDQKSGQMHPSDGHGTHLWEANSKVQRLEAWSKTGKVFTDRPGTSAGLQVGAILHRQGSVFGGRNYDGQQQMLYINGIYQTLLAASPDHELKTGISLQTEKYDERLNSVQYLRQETVPGAFAEYTYKYKEKFTAVAGLRADWHNQHGAFLTPRLHLRFAPTNEDVLRLSIGRGQRTANVIAENTGALASSRSLIIQGEEGSDKPYGLDAEVAWNFGVNYQKDIHLGNGDLTWGIDLYRTNFVNQIVADYDQNPQQVLFYNLDGKSYSNSLQTQLDYTPFGKFDIRLAYRFNEVKTQYKSGLREKPLVSRHRAFLNLAYELEKGWKFDYTLNWQGSKRIPSTASNPVAYQLADRSPAYFLSNAQVSKTLGKRWEVYVGGENLFDFQQPNPILSADDPWSRYFDSSLVWGPINGRMAYGGFRFKIME